MSQTSIRSGKLSQPLITKDLEPEKYSSSKFSSRLSATWKKLLNKDYDFASRIIKPHKDPYPKYLLQPDNRIDNTKFAWYNFVVLFLYYEFSQFSNFYYLLLTISQFFKPLQVGGLKRLLDILCRSFSCNFDF